MPAYSFKKRFVPFVLDGSKTHTIRARRNQRIKAGLPCYLYYGMRTKHCEKLGKEKCLDVRTIMITAESDVFVCNDRLNDADFAQFLTGKLYPNGKWLSGLKKEQLAWRDGFRPAGSSFERPAGSFDLMMEFWKDTHSLPFYGDIIYWNKINAS